MNFLVDPRDVIAFDRTDGELELFWLFCLVVAGKTASTQARLLNNFLLDNEPLTTSDTPFGRISGAISRTALLDKIVKSRLGQYNRLVRAFEQSIALNLRTCTIEDLEEIYGVGPKTARMFLMMSRPNQRYAALDTHVLKHLRANNIDAPKVTPSAGKKYRDLEQEFLRLADESGKSVAEYDLEVWKKYSNVR